MRMILFVVGNKHQEKQQCNADAKSDLTQSDAGVYLAREVLLLLPDWLQKGSLEIVSPSVLRGGEFQRVG